MAAGRALRVGNRCTVGDGQAGFLSQGARTGTGSGEEARGSWDHWLRAGRATTPLRNASVHLTPLRPLTLIAQWQQQPPLWYLLHHRPRLSPGPCLGAAKSPHTRGSRGLVVAWGKAGKERTEGGPPLRGRRQGLQTASALQGSSTPTCLCFSHL